MLAVLVLCPVDECCCIPLVGGVSAAERVILMCFAGQVGEQFITQYYHVKHHNPKYLYRFYNDSSRMAVLDSLDPRGTVTASNQRVRDPRLWICAPSDSH